MINIFSHAGSVTDKTLAALTHHCSHSLERLDVSFVRHISLPVFLHLLGMCVATGRLEEVAVWGCTQLRRSAMESLKIVPAAEREIESGNVLDQLRHMKNNSAGASNLTGGGGSNGVDIDICHKFPTVVGFLDM
jgi:hypothetical protein